MGALINDCSYRIILYTCRRVTPQLANTSASFGLKCESYNILYNSDFRRFQLLFSRLSGLSKSALHANGGRDQTEDQRDRIEPTEDCCVRHRRPEQTSGCPRDQQSIMGCVDRQHGQRECHVGHHLCRRNRVRDIL